MIRLLQLSARNYMSYVKFSVVLENKGIVGIGGKVDEITADNNGAGKSGVFESISWCLYGETIRGMSSDEIVNRGVDKDCEVTLDMFVDNAFYKVSRYRKHTKYGNTVLVYKKKSDKDLEDISRATATDTQEMINNLLGLDFHSFCRTIVFSGGEVSKFSQSSDSERKWLFEKILDLGIYSKCQIVAKDEYKIIENKIELEKNNVDQMERNVVNNEQMLEGYKRDITILEDDFVTLKLKECSVDESTIIDLKNKRSDFRKTREELYKTINDIDEDKIKKLSKIDVRCFEIKAGSIIAEINNLKRKTNICPILKEECNRLGDSTATALRVSELESTLKECDDKVDKLNDESDKIKEDFDSLIKEARSEILNLDIEERKIENQIDDADEIIKYNTSINSKIESVKSRIRIHQKNINDLKNKNCEIKGMISDSNDKIKTMSNDLECYKFWIDAFGLKGIRNMILGDVFPFLNQRLKYYAKDLLGYNIKLSNQTQLKSGATSEKIDMMIDNSAYKTSSEGERRRIDACLLFALQDLVMQRKKKINVLFIDEIFDVLDEVGIENVIKMLVCKLATEGLESIFVISHNAFIVEALPSQMIAVKQNGISRLEDV